MWQTLHTTAMKVALLVTVTVFHSIPAYGRPCKRSACDDSWTQSVSEAEDSVYGDKSYLCHSCINNCIGDKKAAMFGSHFNLNDVDCAEKEAYYKWHFGTAMPDCMEEIGPGMCLKQMKFSCGYDFGNMVKAAEEDCKWRESCKNWGFDNAKFIPEDPNWEPYAAEK